MNVLFASSEAYPFFTSGKLGGMTGSLAASLRRLQVDSRVILPLYNDMKAEWRQRMHYVTNFTVPVSRRNQYCGLFEGTGPLSPRRGRDNRLRDAVCDFGLRR
ncbi:MAG: glycogen/starch synthase [Treponema sp.]|jgi:starch synthase|nr:glycogen/starch synthase [Treponema sp.]